MLKFKQIQILAKKYAKADIIKVFSLTAVATIVKGLTGFISVKVIAVVIGSSGIAMLGQLTNFSSIVMTLATGGIGNGVVKYVAQYKEKSVIIKIYLSTAFRVIIFSSAICSLVLIFFATFFSKVIFFNENYSYVFTLFGATIILYAFNSFFICIVNGYKQFKSYVAINIFDSLSGLIFSLILVMLFGLKGALIGAVTYQSVMFFVTFYFIYKSPWFSFKNFSDKVNNLALKKYLSFTLMTFVSAVTVPTSQLIVRSHLIKSLSAQQAGWWEAMNRLSSLYLMVITTSLGVYYLPKLAEIKEKSDLKNEITNAYKIIIPILIISCTGIYLLRDLVIQFVFSKEFSPIRNLFIWQLFGDIFKISSWIIAYTLIAKSHTKLYIFTEIFFSCLFILLSFILVSINGITGVIQAYLLNYIVCFIFMYLIFRKFILK